MLLQEDFGTQKMMFALQMHQMCRDQEDMVRVSLSFQAEEQPAIFCFQPASHSLRSAGVPTDHSGSAPMYCRSLPDSATHKSTIHCVHSAAHERDL